MNVRSPLPRVLCATLLGALFGASALLWCRQAVAEESDAERLFREGRALVVEQRFAEACPKLEQSQRLEPRLGTKLNVAFCQERLGKIATAWIGFQEAAISARREGDVVRKQFATGRVDALEPRVPWLRVRAAVSAAADAVTILLDGALLAASTWDKELPADPGPHTLVATRGGEEYWRTTVELRESEHLDVTVPAAPPKAVASAANLQPLLVPAASRFVYELGAFAGFINVDTNLSEPDGDPADIQVQLVDENDLNQTLTCDTAACEYFSLGSSSGLVAGVAGFVGYATSRHVALGLRLLVGSRAGDGAFVALGPAASFLIAERFRVGPALLFGTASHTEPGTVSLQGPTGPNSIDTRLNAALGFSTGLGAELGLTLVDNATGSVVLQATPLFLSGSNGMAWCLPLGAAYHWH